MRRDTLYVSSDDPSGPPPLPFSSIPLFHATTAPAFRWHPLLRTLSCCQLLLPSPHRRRRMPRRRDGVRGSVVLLIACNHASHPRDATPTFAFPSGNSRGAPWMQPLPRSFARRSYEIHPRHNSTDGSGLTHT